jgi:class 3 adenylate cyclase/tetratricopeptide (TPR) repeat protein
VEESGCPACAARVAGDARFCTACGARLTATCPGCGRVADRSHRFCAGCGRPLQAGSAGPAPATHRSEGERKQVTVLFADVAGSMNLAEGSDPEDWAALMDRFFRLLSEGIARFGGTVDKFTGDGVMALFGAPVSQEDHARRACLAALHLQAATVGLDLPVRVGLNSGEVVVGGIGAEGRLEYTALGHTVGLAQRMEALAEPGTVCVTDGTARLVRHDFALRELGTVPVKGSSEPLRVLVLERSQRRRPTGGATVMVGRAEEMGVLEAALGRALEGQGQVVGIVGEAGVGKSRLCEEFVRSVTARGITVRRAAGLSHAQDVPLLPVLEFLRDYFGIEDTDSRAQAQERIAGRLLALDPGFGDALPLVFDFLEVPDPERPLPQLSADVRMQRIFAVIRRITQRRSDREALVLLFEDLHWFDPHSRAFLERLVPSFPATRTLVLTNFRPEFSPPWASHSYYRQVPLQPLDDDAVGRLLDGLLGRDDSLAPLVKLIAETTGGSPFFVEEVVRSLVEDGTLAGEPGAYRLTRSIEHLAVPATVQATLAARIDRLSEQDRGVLQTAAVIGRNFTEPVLRLVSRLAAEDAARILGRLGAAEFIHEVAHDPVEEYRFWHPLTQEVAYGTLLRERRTALHNAVAEAIVASDPDRLDERAALIAAHYEQAGNRLEAARWHDRAGDVAVRNDVPEAMRRWRAALTHLAAGPDTDDALRIGVHARTRLIRYRARTEGDPAETGRLYVEARTIADASSNLLWSADVTSAYAASRHWGGAVAEALGLYQEAMQLADRAGSDDARAAIAAAVAGVAIRWAGAIAVGTAAMEDVLTVTGGQAHVGRHIWGFSLLPVLGVARCELFALQGSWPEARQALADGLAIARDEDAVEWIIWLLSMTSRCARTPDEFAAALHDGEEGARLAEECGNVASHVVALGAVGLAQLGLGGHQAAADALQKGLDLARSHQVGLFEEGNLLAHLALAHLGLGDGDTAVRLAAEAVDVTRRQGARGVECHALIIRARIGTATGRRASEVRDDLDEAMVIARDMGATAYEAEIEAERTAAASLFQ